MAISLVSFGSVRQPKNCLQNQLMKRKSKFCEMVLLRFSWKHHYLWQMKRFNSSGTRVIKSFDSSHFIGWLESFHRLTRVNFLRVLACWFLILSEILTKFSTKWWKNRLFQETPIVIPFQHLHLLNCYLIEFNKPLALWNSFIDKHGINIFRVWEAYQLIDVCMPNSHLPILRHQCIVPGYKEPWNGYYTPRSWKL